MKGLDLFQKAFGRLPLGQRALAQLEAEAEADAQGIALKPARPDLGPNQLEWCARRIRGFRACRKAVNKATANARRAALKAGM